MSEFTPNTRVRCIDCSKYSNGSCLGKHNHPKTAPRKRRICGVYEFSGELKNRTPLPSEFRPFWWFYSKKEKKLLAHLMSLGISPVAGDSPMVVPQSTALASPVSPESDPLLITVGDSHDSASDGGS